MNRAPAASSLLFVIAAGLAILLSGPLLLFNPWFVSFEQGRFGVAPSLESDQAGVDRVTAPMLADLVRNGDFGESLNGRTPILDSAERSHMRDVGGLVRALLAIEVVALIVLAIAGRRLRNARARRGRLLLTAAGGVGAGAILLAAFFAISFEAAFAAFHALFFAAGTWQFGPDSNLIRLFPEPFWFEVSLLAGASIVLSALIAALLGRRDLRLAEAAA